MGRHAVARIGQARSLGRASGALGLAVRLPERSSGTPELTLLPHQYSPRLFVHEGARQALERRLMAALPGPVSLSITDNRHSIISHTWERGMLRARIHHMFLDAPANIQTALVRYVAHADRAASVRIGHYIEANGARLAKRSRRMRLDTRGAHHDLLAIFQDVNDRYFGGSVNALVTWGQRARRPKHAARARATIKLGSYSANERLIRIHPALDCAWVPRYFVAYIVYHEMLHHVIPARLTSGGAQSRRGGGASGRRELHPAEFRAREREFRHFERALRWEQQHLGRLLRS